MKYRGWAMAFLLATAAIIWGQFPRIPKLPKIPVELPGNVPGVDKLLAGEPPITTSLKDATFDLPFLDGYNPQAPVTFMAQPRRPDGGFLLAPGFYGMPVQSYCLHAGTRAPSSGD